MSAVNLTGLCVLNTRPANQADALSQQIREAQGRVIHCPTLAIEAVENSWLNVLPSLTEVDQAIFVSANAVTHSFAQFSQKRMSWPRSIKVIAIGQGTASYLQQQGIRVDALPAQADSEHLLMLPSLQNIHAQQILLFKGIGGRPLIGDTLRSRGAKLIELSVYRRNKPDTPNLHIQEWWQDNSVDIILITSQDALCNLFAMVGQHNVNRLQAIPCLVISARLADAANELGMQTIIVSRLERIMEALHQFNKGRDNG